jgi:hypothetical protein
MDVLMVDKLHRIVNGQTSRPARDTSDERDWHYTDAQARVLIKKSLLMEAFLHTHNCETAAEIFQCITQLREPESSNVMGCLGIGRTLSAPSHECGQSDQGNWA